ncbi:MAG: DNA gyrase subunit A [Fibrobacteria bacterium]|nr:DNA gyrase subunit A [Fibrobacteria bacterium]
MAEEEKPKERIQIALIQDEMKKSYVTYAMSVIVSRALPDVRDGLKPVHRRVLFGMDNLNLHPGRPYKKSARIVGDVIGKYHPHGDTAVYHTLVRMAQDFSLRYRLVDGQGNFGSIDGDAPAAMRYTEARMQHFARLMLEDLEKDTVDFSPNYDDSMEEPTVLPSAFPNLLVNGTTGIAVGMATNLAPHNLREITNAIVAVIQDPEIPDEELFALVSGPDFPTGGIIHGRQGIRMAYLTGRGKVQVRALTDVEDFAKGRQRIIVTEIPFQVNKSNLLEKMADLVRHKVIEVISDIRDESDKDGMRIVIELKKDAFPEVVLNQLYKYTQLQGTFSINNLALVDGKPKVLPLRSLIQEYIKHRHVIVVRRSQFDLRNAEARAHILEGLRIALQNIDKVIATIRESSSAEEARAKLQEYFSLSEKQAHAIVEMRLRSLTGLEIEKIENEYRELQIKIADLKDILSNEERRKQIIIDELTAISNKYGDERRTSIQDATDEVQYIDLVANEPMVITVSHNGYIKRIPTDTYKAQGRGGKGITAATVRDEDFVEHLFVGWAHSFILIFTNLGRCHWLRVYEIPEGGRTSKGKALINFINLQAEEKVAAFVPVKSFEDDRALVFATQNGIINKMPLTAFANRRATGINAIKLVDSDRLIRVEKASDDQDVMIGTRCGQAIRFAMSKFRVMGRGTMGVRGIRLAPEDKVIGMVVISENKTILTVTELGYGKRTNPDEYRITGRGGKGVRNIKITEKNGHAVAIAVVQDDQELMILTKNGLIIKMKIATLNILGRNTQGVRAIRLKPSDIVADVEIMDADEDLEGNEDGDTDTQPKEAEVTDSGDALEINNEAETDVQPEKEEISDSEEALEENNDEDDTQPKEE